MKRTRLLVLAALTMTTCVREDLPCNGLRKAGDYLSCDALCGSGPNAIECSRQRSVPSMEVFEEWCDGVMELQWSPGAGTGRILGEWWLGDVSDPDTLEIMRSARYHSQRNSPPPAFRITENPYPWDPFPADMTFFFQAMRISGACFTRWGVAARWEPEGLMGGDLCFMGGLLETSEILLEQNGYCPDTDQMVGDSNHYWGVLTPVHSVALGYCDTLTCFEDGECVPYCRVDYDCPCHGDGVCDPVGCVADAECECVADGVCIPSCPGDPDCRCIADDECDPACMELDPDCPCAEDGFCSPACLASDPDCGCADDGDCLPVCGWMDPDCQCLSDGTCNTTCDTGEDPDCV